MKKAAVLLIIKHDAEMLIGGAALPGRRTAARGLETGDGSLVRESARLVGLKPQNISIMRAVCLGRAAVGVCELGQGRRGPFRERLGGERAACRGQLAKLDERLGPVRTGGF